MDKNTDDNFEKFYIFVNKKFLVGFFITIFLLLSVFFFYYQKKTTSEAIERLNDKLVLSLYVQLDKERNQALQNALIISKNSNLLYALNNDDEDKGFDILSEMMDSIKTHTDATVRAQIITADNVIFARSWDNSYSGMPLDFHRPDLIHFQKHRNPRTSVEVGRKLGVKATVPVFLSNLMLGYVEVVSFFETTVGYFDSLGIKLYVLMDDKFYNTAVFMQDNPTIDNYVLANPKYTKSDIELLEKIDFKTLKSSRIVVSGTHYFFYEPMKNGEGEVIGAYVFALTPQQIGLYVNAENEDVSFMIHLTRNELYDVTMKQSHEKIYFQSNYDKELLYLKDTVAPEDRELFLEEAKERLNQYSKEELIGIILDYKVNKEIRGEIR